MTSILTTYVCVGGRSWLWGGEGRAQIAGNEMEPLQDHGNFMLRIMMSSSKFSRGVKYMFCF